MIGKKNILIGIMMLSIFIGPMTVSTASATDWPMFQENLNHTACMDEASDFNPDTWLFQTSGLLTSAAITDKLIYFGSSSGLFSALNLEDGTKVWDYKQEET